MVSDNCQVYRLGVIVMQESFEKVLGQARWRYALNMLLEVAGAVLLLAGVVAMLMVLLERLFWVPVLHGRLVDLSAVSYGGNLVNGGMAVNGGITEGKTGAEMGVGGFRYWVVLSGVGVAILLLLVLWLRRFPGKMQVALQVDERLGLRERFSTALALADSGDAFARAACVDARNYAEHISRVKNKFPVRLSRRWGYAGVLWLAVVLMVVMLPQEDLLGLGKKKTAKRQEDIKLKQTLAVVKKTTDTVKAAVKQLDDPELAKAADELARVPRAARPDKIKRQVIRKLGDMADRLQKKQVSDSQQGLKMMQQILKQLRRMPGMKMQQLQQALAKGDFSKAQKYINQMQKELSEGKLSKKKQEELAKQLRDMAKQLKKLAQVNKQLEKELKKLGLDKKLARLNKKALQNALEKRGLSQQQIRILMEKMAACRNACSRCNKLGQAMTSCSSGGGAGVSSGALNDLADQLSELDAMQQDMKLSQATLDRINKSIAALGQRMGQGLCEGGGQGPFSPGVSNKYHSGSGGPGKGIGVRDTAKNGKSSTVATKLKNKNKPGPIVASWYFKGQQVKGQARREVKQVVQAAKERATEAVSENCIPDKYKKAVKQYFGGLDSDK